MTEHTVDRSGVKRLERSRSDWMLAGVCGGLARYFDIHPAFYRVGFVVLSLIGGAGILVYAAAALVIPDEGKEDSIASAALRNRRERPWPLIGLGLIAVAGAVLLSRVRLWPAGDLAWILLLLLGVTVIWASRDRRAATLAEEAAATSGSAGSVAPEEAAAASTASAAAPTASAPRRPRRVLRAVAVAVGSLVALVLVLGAVFATVFHVHVGRGIGNRAYVPTTVEDLHRSYRLGIGDLRVDLSRVRLPVGETRVKARVDVGDLRVVVPADAKVRLRGEAQLGYVNLLGLTDDGHNARESVDETGQRVLVLDTHVGVGSVRVTRAVP
jgi:phage shock protein PspC (stress-responsive transcriptional regulator)